MGCGSSQVSSNPSSQVKPAAVVDPSTTAGTAQPPASTTLLAPAAAKPAEVKVAEVEFVPATNIQYEIPEAFKDKAPLVPVGFPTIASLETIKLPLTDEQISWVAGVSKTGEVGSEIFCIQASFQFEYAQKFWFDNQLALAKQSEKTKHKFSRAVHKDREYWYQMGAVMLVVGGTEHTLEGHAHMTHEQNGQFWGDYLFFVSNDGVLQAVEIKPDGNISQMKVSASNEEGTIPSIYKFEICAAGNSMLSVLSNGELANGVELLPEYQGKMGQFKASKNVHMRSFGYEEASFYNFQRLSTGDILVFADNYSGKKFMVGLMTASLEAKHMLTFTQPDNDSSMHRPSIIREDSWRGHPLIISAREIFEIDLFLIAKNQIMHLQTIASFKDQTGFSDIDEFKSLSKVDNTWYLGSPFKEEFPLLRKLVWN